MKLKNSKLITHVLLCFIVCILIVETVCTVASFCPKMHQDLASWFSSLGTTAAILFVYFQISEQRDEFNEANKIECQISTTQKNSTQETDADGMTRVVPNANLHIWAVNSGGRVASFMFLGICRKEDFSNLNTKDVLYNPNFPDGEPYLWPARDNQFELLQPGQVSQPQSIIIRDLEAYFNINSTQNNGKKTFYIVYMDAMKNKYHQEITIQ